MLKQPFLSFLSVLFELYPDGPTPEVWEVVKRRLQGEFVKVTGGKITPRGYGMNNGIIDDYSLVDGKETIHTFDLSDPSKWRMTGYLPPQSLP